MLPFDPEWLHVPQEFKTNCYPHCGAFEHEYYAAQYVPNFRNKKISSNCKWAQVQ